jgi:hypothetical protein
MRKITIHQNDAKDIQINDDSDEPLDQYCERLSELMKMGNVAIIKTSSASVVVRPSKIVGIKVEAVESTVSEEIPIPTQKTEQTTETHEDVVEDIITDVDN